jgi:succinoglycan biosynthesis protein ExoA
MNSREPAVSVVLPVLNEVDHLEAAVLAALNQKYSGEIEVILALGPSKDGTDEVAERISQRDKRVKLVSNPTGKTATALNLAIKASKFDYIVRIDGHSEIDPDYIKIAIDTLINQKNSGVVNVGGIMAAEGITQFQKALAVAMRSPLGVGNSRFHTGGLAGESDTVYLGVFDKKALLNVGGFDERFIRAQDWELNHRLRLAGGKIWFEPALKVIYRPRRNLRALAKQYFEYGRWRRAVSRAHLGTVNFRYLAPPALVSILILSGVLSVTTSLLFLIPIAGYFAALTLGGLLIGKSWWDRLALPFILATMHIAWGLGFLTSPKRLIH